MNEKIVLLHPTKGDEMETLRTNNLNMVPINNNNNNNNNNNYNFYNY